MQISLASLINRFWPRPAALAPTPPAAPRVETDRLRLSPEARQAPSASDRLSGAFVQLHDDQISVAECKRMLTAMQRLGMDTVVVQYSQYGATDLTHATEAMLSAADDLGMKVIVGTQLKEGSGLTDSWYVKQFLSGPVAQEAKDVAAYTGDLVKRLAAHPSLSGLYIPFEVNGLADARVIGDFYGAIARAAKEAKPDLQVMVSPYTAISPAFSPSVPESRMTDWWDTVLSRAPIDVVAWQDGVGGAADRLKIADRDLGALAKATEKHGVQLWADLEAFHRTSGRFSGFAAEPQAMDVLTKQIQTEGPKVSKLIAFDFNDYMDPQAGEAQARLYQQYQDYLAQLPPVTR